MKKDPIVDEIRKVRHEIELTYGSSEAFFRHLKELQKQYQARLVRRPRATSPPSLHDAQYHT